MIFLAKVGHIFIISHSKVVITAYSFIKKPYLSLLFWGGLLFLSIVYASERASFADSAWQFFQKLNSERFIFPQQRYGVFWMAIPSWVFIKTGLPLIWQIYIFSISYILAYFFIWWICYSPLKNKKAAWLVLLSLLLGTRQNFVHTSSETLQVLAFSALLYAVLQSELNFWTKGILSTLLLANTMMIHPIAVFVLGFVVISEIIRLPVQRFNWHIALLGILIGWSFFRFVFSSGNYDAGQYALLKDIKFKDLLPWNWVSLKFLITRSYYLYWPTGLLAIWSLFQLWRIQQKTRAIILLMAVGGYTLIALLTFRAGDSDYMMEKNFLPSVFMISLLFLETLFLVNSELKESGSRYLLIASIGGLIICWRGISLFSDRLNTIDELIELSLKANQTKSAVIESQLKSEIMLVNWALGTETYLRSHSKYKRSCTICTVSALNSIENTSDFLAVPWEIIPIKELNSTFFVPDSSRYQLLPLKQTSIRQASRLP